VGGGKKERCAVFGGIGEDLTDQKEIGANKKGRITKRQQYRFGGVIWQKKQFWLGMALSGFVPTVGLFLGAVSAFGSGRSDSGNWPIGLLGGAVGLFCLWILPSMRTFLRWRKLERNLEHESMAKGMGRVEWKRKRYVLKLDDGKKLDPIYSPNLFPGRYLFYYLPRFRWALSAELIDPNPQTDDLEMLNRRLAIANHFDIEALPENRIGQLTPAQRITIPGRLLGAILIVTMGMVLFLVYFMQSGGTLETMWLIILILVGMAAATAFVTRKSLSSVWDCFVGQVLSSEGLVTKDLEEATDSSMTYYYKLNGTYFTVTEAGYEALIPSLIYRIYFLPRSQKLVNIEAGVDTT
jgi:hypothetical protein